MKWCNTAVFAWYVGVTLFALVASRHVDAVPPNDHQVRQWANLLGSPNFTEREDATQKLLSRGLASLHILDALSQNSDREVRFRSKRIVALIHDRYRASRLAAFKAGKSADLHFGELPGWTAFALRFGDGEKSRNVYADMLESEWSLLSRAYDDELTIPVRELLAQRLNQLRLRGYRNYSMGTALVMYLLAADIPDEIVIHRQVNGLCLQNSDLRAALAPSARRTIVRQIVGTWVAGISSQNANANICLFTAMRFQLQEGAFAARRILENKTTTATIKNLAMQTLANFGDKSQAGCLTHARPRRRRRD